MRSRLHMAAAGLLIGGVVAAQLPATADEIGSWVMTCPSDARNDRCLLRHRNWILPPGTSGPSVGLEVLHRADQFVPVIAVRGLSMQAALGGVLALQANVGLRFDNAARIELACGLDGASAVICAPEGSAMADAAAQLASAHNVLVQMRISVPGGTSLPEQTRSLELQRTADALARFGNAVPSGMASSALPGLDWRGYLERFLHAVGF